MKERKYGKIINISSVAAKRDPIFVAAYGAAKNGVLTLTRVVAKDLGPHNVNVNAICPGFVWTNFWERLGPQLAEADPSYAGLDARGVFDRLVTASTPLGREQSPEDIGNLVVFLSSEESRNITGQSSAWTAASPWDDRSGWSLALALAAPALKLGISAYDCRRHQPHMRPWL